MHRSCRSFRYRGHKKGFNRRTRVEGSFLTTLFERQLYIDKDTQRRSIPLSMFHAVRYHKSTLNIERANSKIVTEFIAKVSWRFFPRNLPNTVLVWSSSSYRWTNRRYWRAIAERNSESETGQRQKREPSGLNGEEKVARSREDKERLGSPAVCCRCSVYKTVFLNDQLKTGLLWDARI